MALARVTFNDFWRQSGEAAVFIHGPGRVLSILSVWDEAIM